MTQARPLVLDATMALAPVGGACERSYAEAMAATPAAFAAMVRRDARGLRAVSVAMLAERAAACAAADPFDAVRAWLVGQGRRPEAPPAPRRASGWRWPRPTAPGGVLPKGAVLLVPGLDAWDALAPALARDDLAVLSLIEVPTALDWPEYAPAGEAAALPRRLAAMAARSDAIVVPDDGSRERLTAALGGSRIPPVHVIAPSFLGAAVRDDAALGAAGYLLAIDRIEARANTALLLHVWRDLLRAGGPVPRLVLAGERGAQVEEIRPLLAWNPAIRAHVVEAPGLSPIALARLVAQARAVLSPAFARGDMPLLGEVAARGTPLLVSDTLPMPPAGALRCSPIDGHAWRAAIRDAAVAGPRPLASLQADDPAQTILALAASL